MLFSAANTIVNYEVLISLFNILRQFLYSYLSVIITRHVFLGEASSPGYQLAREIADFERFLFEINTRLDTANFFLEPLLFLLTQSNSQLEFTRKSSNSSVRTPIAPPLDFQNEMSPAPTLPFYTPITKFPGMN